MLSSLLAFAAAQRRCGVFSALQRGLVRLDAVVFPAPSATQTVRDLVRGRAC